MPRDIISRLKAKPVDLHEVGLIRDATVFVVKDYDYPEQPPVLLTRGLAEVREVLADFNRKLVYGYNQEKQDKGMLPVTVLVTARNLRLYDELKKGLEPVEFDRLGRL